MELNSKKLRRRTRFLYYSISTILALFLIMLSNKIISDLDSTVLIPSKKQFENSDLLSNYYNEKQQIQLEIGNLDEKKETIETTIERAKLNYKNEKQSFDNWLQTRKTLGSPDNDQAVINKAKKLDEFYKIEKNWRAKLHTIQTQIDNLYEKQEAVEEKIRKENEIARAKYHKALKTYELKVFLIRLLFVAPILAIGIFFFLRYRKNKFWSLYFGFTLFSIYAFFFGLVPYLPSYGGYVRYSVGIILSVGLGYYAIKSISIFVEKKKAELKISTAERAKNVKQEIAEKALENHYCPSCGKDFIIKNWEIKPLKSNDNQTYKLVTNYCRHCGLELFKECDECGTKNFIHLPFCSNCGIATNKQ